jgi:basic amino acid/polyamine antiporter, APA family
MIGFDFISTISEEAQNTKRDAPIAMRDTVIICTIIYLFVAVALIGMGLGKTINYQAETAFADLYTQSGMSWMTIFIYLCAIIGMTASLFTLFMGTVRVIQSLSREGLIPQLFGESSPTTGIPIKTCYITFVVLAILAFC